MEDVSNVEHNQCSAGCINPLLQHDIGEDGTSERDNTTRGFADGDSVTASEETVPLVQAATESPDRFLLIFLVSFIILSILLISLYSTGFFVPGTILLCVGIVLALLVVAKRFGGYADWGRRRDLYSQL